MVSLGRSGRAGPTRSEAACLVSVRGGPGRRPSSLVCSYEKRLRQPPRPARARSARAGRSQPSREAELFVLPTKTSPRTAAAPQGGGVGAGLGGASPGASALCCCGASKPAAGFSTLPGAGGLPLVMAPGAPDAVGIVGIRRLGLGLGRRVPAVGLAVSSMLLGVADPILTSPPPSWARPGSPGDTGPGSAPAVADAVPAGLRIALRRLPQARAGGPGP